MRVEVTFAASSRRYCYSAPKGTRKGDVVKVPASWCFNYEQYGVVTGPYPNYTSSPVKSVLAVYREIER